MKCIRGWGGVCDTFLYPTWPFSDELVLPDFASSDPDLGKNQVGKAGVAERSRSWIKNSCRLA